MPRLLHLADLHLGWIPRGLPPEAAAAVRRRRDGLLAEAVDVALRERVDLVVVAGDLFESYRPESGLAGEALRQLRRLVDGGVAVVTVPGNHDELTYARSVYRVEAATWPGVLVTRPRPGPVAHLHLGGVDVHVTALAYVGGITPVDAPLRAFGREQSEGLQVAVFHGTLVGPAVRPGDPFAGGRSLPIDARALAAAGFDYVALGHLHVPHEVALGGGRLAVYPGCVGGKGPGDVGAAHWTIVEFGGGPARVRRVPANSAPVWTRDLDVGTVDDAAGLEARLRAWGAPDAWGRVRLTGSLGFDLDAAALQARAAHAYLHLEVDDATSSVAAALLDDWAAQPTVRGAFVRQLHARLAAAPDAPSRALLTRALRRGLHALSEEP